MLIVGDVSDGAFAVLISVEVERANAADVHTRKGLNYRFYDGPRTGGGSVFGVGVVGGVAQYPKQDGYFGLVDGFWINKAHECVQSGLCVLLRFGDSDLRENSEPLLSRRIGRILRVVYEG